MAVKKGSTKGTKKKITAAKPAVKKLTTIKEPLSKGGILNAMSEMTGLARKEAGAALEAFLEVISLHLKPRGGVGVFTLPGYFKMALVKKPARPARKGINPFTGEEVTFKAKPAFKAVKIRPLKKLKAIINQ